jgi:SAM-dependent methyltransferase
MRTDNSDILLQLEAWYARNNGRYLVENIRNSLETTLDTAFGYHVLQLGVTRQHPLFEHSHINHRVYAAEKSGSAIGLVTQSDELPLESDSIDILIAHHSLEFAENPHQVLREMQRVLAPQGQLIIIGFNPYSAFGSMAYIKGLSRSSVWHHHHPVSAHRVTDWLHLLGCEVQQRNYLYAVPPQGVGKVRDLMIRCDNWFEAHNAPVGGLYILHAVKQTLGMNRLRRRLLASGERLIGLAVPKPRGVPSPAPSVHKKKGEVAA